MAKSLTVNVTPTELFAAGATVAQRVVAKLANSVLYNVNSTYNLPSKRLCLYVTPTYMRL